MTNDNELDSALNELFSTQSEQSDTLKEPVSNDAPIQTPQNKLKDAMQSVMQTYQEQNEMRKRSNAQMTAFLKGINPDKPMKKVLDEAIDLIGTITANKAYADQLKNKINQTYGS
ncbi:hypothetical protein ACTQ54_12290 [Fundicoccus sp. Sow4_H7]|uniref:hypothetical protein n=1 Tax=Fundicoccus sp. Sow4_H7 TaxID=3438784 RepID=UPI003F8F9F9D